MAHPLLDATTGAGLGVAMEAVDEVIRSRRKWVLVLVGLLAGVALGVYLRRRFGSTTYGTAHEIEVEQVTIASAPDAGAAVSADDAGAASTPEPVEP